MATYQRLQPPFWQGRAYPKRLMFVRSAPAPDPAWYSALRDIDLELADITGHVVKLKTSQERRCYRQARTDAELILGILGVVFECFGKIRIGRRPIHALAGRARLRRREKSEPIIIIEDIWNDER